MSVSLPLFRVQYETENSLHAMEAIKKLKDKSPEITNGSKLSHRIRCVADVADIYHLAEDLKVVSKVGLAGCRLVMQFLENVDHKTSSLHEIINEESGFINLNELFGCVGVSDSVASFHWDFVRDLDAKSRYELGKIAVDCNFDWLRKDDDGYYYLIEEEAKYTSKIVLSDIPLFFGDFLLRNDSYEEQATNFIIKEFSDEYVFHKLPNEKLMIITKP